MSKPSDEAVRKEFHPDAAEIIKFLRDVVCVNMADSDWKQAEQFIDAAVQASRSAAIQECADFVRGHERRAEEHSLKTGRLVEHRDCFNKLADALLALKER